MPLTWPKRDGGPVELSGVEFTLDSQSTSVLLSTVDLPIFAFDLVQITFEECWISYHNNRSDQKGRTSRLGAYKASIPKASSCCARIIQDFHVVVADFDNEYGVEYWNQVINIDFGFVFGMYFYRWWRAFCDWLVFGYAKYIVVIIDVVHFDEIHICFLCSASLFMGRVLITVSAMNMRPSHDVLRPPTWPFRALVSIMGDLLYKFFSLLLDNLVWATFSVSNGAFSISSSASCRQLGRSLVWSLMGPSLWVLRPPVDNLGTGTFYPGIAWAHLRLFHRHWM